MEEVRGTTMNVNKTSGQLYNNVTYFLVLSEKKTESTDLDSARFCIYTACSHVHTHVEVKIQSQILSLIILPCSHLQIIIVTAAFGMGLDCRNVKKR